MINTVQMLVGLVPVDNALLKLIENIDKRTNTDIQAIIETCTQEAYKLGYLDRDNEGKEEPIL